MKDENQGNVKKIFIKFDQSFHVELGSAETISLSYSEEKTEKVFKLILQGKTEEETNEWKSALKECYSSIVDLLKRTKETREKEEKESQKENEKELILARNILKERVFKFAKFLSSQVDNKQTESELHSWGNIFDKLEQIIDHIDPKKMKQDSPKKSDQNLLKKSFQEINNSPKLDQRQSQENINSDKDEEEERKERSATIGEGKTFKRNKLVQLKKKSSTMRPRKIQHFDN